jgi:hypothetical protein
MILLYTFVLIVLGLALWVVNRRVSALEQRYGKTAIAAEVLARNTSLKGGNGKLPDALESAKHVLLLGQLAQRRDRVESQWHAWQRRSDRLHRLVAGLKEWKGAKLPYAFGALDVTGSLYLIDRYGVAPYIRWDYMVELVRQCVGY